MNWVDRLRTSADERVLSGRRAVVIAWWALWGLFVPHWPFVSPWIITLVILGLEVLRAHLLGLCCTAVFHLIFLQLRKGLLWSCAELLQSYVLCSSDQCGTEKSRLPAVRELFWGMLGRGDGELRGKGVSGSGYNKVLALEVLNVVWLRRTKETCRAPCVCISSLRVWCRAVVPGVLACVHMYILYVCVYICICVYVCGHVYIYVCACVYVYVYVCVYTHVYVYVYVYLCIDCGSQYQCFSVWTVSCMRMCIRVYMLLCLRMHMCVGIYICAFFCSERCIHFGTGVLGTSARAGVYVTQVCFYTNVHICEHSRYRLFAFIYTRVWVYIYTCVGAFCLFVLSNLSATCACITGVS